MHRNLAEQLNALHLILQNQHVRVVGKVMPDGLRRHLRLLRDLLQNARLQFLMHKRCADDDAFLRIVFAQVGQLFDLVRLA